MVIRYLNEQRYQRRFARFDKLLYLGVSQDHESQLRIIQALTRK